jgi:hypothetical protein
LSNNREEDNEWTKSSEQILELFFDLLLHFLILLLILNARNEEIVQFLSDAIERLLHLLEFVPLMLIHLLVVEEYLVLDELRIGV